MLTPRKLTLITIASGLMLISASAFADDSCSVDQVIQPAIDLAAASAACNADGQYVSPRALGEEAINACIGLTDKSSCRRCLAEGIVRATLTSRMLVKAGFFRSGAVVQTLQAIYNMKDKMCK